MATMLKSACEQDRSGAVWPAEHDQTDWIYKELSVGSKWGQS